MLLMVVGYFIYNEVTQINNNKYIDVFAPFIYQRKWAVEIVDFGFLSFLAEFWSYVTR